jgi:hypothetical protein
VPGRIGHLPQQFLAFALFPPQFDFRAHPVAATNDASKGISTVSNVATMLASAAAKRAASGKPAPAPAKDETKLAWENIEPDTLPDDIREAYYAIGKARSAFESAMSTLLEPPAHLKLAFAYKRGLAIALAPRAARGLGLEGLIARINAAE